MLLSICLILSVCCVFVFAATDSELLAALNSTPYTYIDVNNAQGYSMTRNSARLVCIINAANLEAYTKIPVSPDGTGYAYVSLKAADGTIANKNSSANPGSGYVTTPYAIVYGQTSFERIVHSGYRTQSGVTTNYAFWCH